ncbi:MAG: hypothetical protein J4O03_07645 [Chloroflexi bacterium]|nr:hypothetical protein [Chloroflexota bacterium]MCH8350065.1 hypothetical protein [Chloroflexota bacterium]MCI0781064.1 hypothetical protein [Chloroflexota bacterium]MCI0786463.1 hypothetical protein [Chloroflexota bacterium]MCI0793323.1 hypothetical protein [Chloroflexota bacterium]
MVSQTDANEVRLTGENNYMRLHEEENGPMTTRASHWRVLFSPGGPGHVLFLRSDLTGDEPRIYSDNIALVRWMQGEITTSGEFADQGIPVINAVFTRSGDTAFFWTENIDTDEEAISMTWFDFGEPFVIGVPVGSNPDRPLGWNSVFIPARKAQLMMNGTVAVGRAFPEQRGDRTSSTAGLALSETWVRP